jgi:hypothetical protein
MKNVDALLLGRQRVWPVGRRQYDELERAGEGRVSALRAALAFGNVTPSPADAHSAGQRLRSGTASRT